MEIKKLITKVLHDNFSETEADKAEKILKALSENGFVFVAEWIDYTKQSPRLDGRYQIFIGGEQLSADWESPYGFSDPFEGGALIQEYISHWALLPEPPKTQEQSND